MACGWSEQKSPRCPVGRSAGLDISCRMIKEAKIVYLHGPPGAARSRKDWVASWVLTAARIWRHVRPFGGRYSASLVQPARIMQSASSVDAVLSDGDASAGERLDRADPWRRLEADIDRLRRFSFSAISRYYSKMPWPGKGFLNQSRNWAVESTWSLCLPLGKTVIAWRYSASQGALAGIWICLKLGVTQSRCVYPRSLTSSASLRQGALSASPQRPTGER